MLFRSSRFLEIGRFDESLTTSEECELCERARAFGSPVVAYPEIGVVHLGAPKGLGEFFRKQSWHGTHALKVFLRHSGRQNLRPVAFAVITLFLLGAGLAGLLLGVVTGAWWLLMAALLGLVATPVGLSLRTALARRRPGDILPLLALNLAYGVARAICLIRVRDWLPAKIPGQRTAR